jgi:hypothetical protein
MNIFTISRICHSFGLVLCTAIVLWVQFQSRELRTPPSILVQPRNQSVSLGADVRFRVAAQAAVPLFSGNTIRRPLGAVNSDAVLTNVQMLDAGDYAVIVSNNFGSVTSHVATLNIDPAFTKITVGPVVNDRGIPPESVERYATRMETWTFSSATSGRL